MPVVTVLQPDPEVPVGRFGPWLADGGLRLEVVPLWKSPMPAVGEGLLILGGRMNCRADSEHPWLPEVRRLVRTALDAGTPILGICLGHQIIADTLGGEVTIAHPEGGQEGPVRLHWEPSATTDPMLGSVAGQGSCLVTMSHHDVVTGLPPDSVELARTDRYPNQVFRHGSAIGVQFHPEAGPDQVARWAELCGRDAEADRRALAAVDAQVSASAHAVALGFAAAVAGVDVGSGRSVPEPYPWSGRWE